MRECESEKKVCEREREREREREKGERVLRAGLDITKKWSVA